MARQKPGFHVKGGAGRCAAALPSLFYGCEPLCFVRTCGVVTPTLGAGSLSGSDIQALEALTIRLVQERCRPHQHEAPAVRPDPCHTGRKAYTRRELASSPCENPQSEAASAGLR